MYEDIYIYVPRFRNIIRISEGSGDNLTVDDIENGYVDYIYYDIHDLNAGLPEYDGGIIMMTNRVEDEFKSMKDAECIERVLDMTYGDVNVAYIVLEQ